MNRCELPLREVTLNEPAKRPERRASRGGQPVSRKSALTGRLHSVESFGAVDGPGIRQVLFFQGCHLRCQFCQNRDTWERDSGREVGIDELVAEIVRFAPYMKASGGGVTASGGDPILQAPFVAELFRRLHREGLHTALDTSGVARITDAVAELLDATDLVLLDLKQIDDAAHRTLTGVSNAKVLAFARHLAAIGKPIWVRHVVIPGRTSDAGHARRLAEFLAEISPVVERVELLPYHDHGREKWIALGEDYPLDGVPAPTAEEMERVRAEVARAGIPVFVA